MTGKPILLITAILGSLAAAAQASPPTPAEAMATPMKDVAISGTLAQAIARVAQAAGVTIDVDWAALAAEGTRDDAKVTVQAASATPAAVLDSLLAQAAKKDHPLAWQADGKRVTVSTQKRILDKSARSKLDQLLPAAPAAAAPANSPSNAPAATAAAAGRGGTKLEFENAPLGEVMTFLKEAAGVNMHVSWKALETVKIDTATPVTLKAAGISVAKALDLVLSDLNAGKNKFDSVYWVIDDGVLLVTTGTALNTELRTKVYDVADLLLTVPDFPGPTMNLQSNSSGNSGSNNTGSGGGMFASDDANGGSPKDDSAAPAAARKAVRETLVGIIQDAVGKDMWQPEGKGTIRLLGNQLIVSQTLLGYKLMEKATGQ